MLWNTKRLVTVHIPRSTNIRDSTVQTHKPSKHPYTTFYIKKFFLLKLLVPIAAVLWLQVVVCGSRGRLAVRGSDLFGQRHDQQREDTVHRDMANVLDPKSSPSMTSGGSGSDARNDIPMPHLKGLIRLVDAVKDAFRLVEEKHGWSSEPVSSAATFIDGQYMQAVVDAVRQSSKTREWVRVRQLTELPDPNPFLSAALRRSTISLQ